jgi:hypothetical protein
MASANDLAKRSFVTLLTTLAATYCITLLLNHNFAETFLFVFAGPVPISHSVFEYPDFLVLVIWLKAKLRTLLNSLQQALIHYFSIDGFCKLSCQEEFRHSVDNPASYCIILQMNHKFAETCWDVCGPSSNFTHHRSESPLSLRSSLEMQLPHPPPES